MRLSLSSLNLQIFQEQWVNCIYSPVKKSSTNFQLVIKYIYPIPYPGDKGKEERQETTARRMAMGYNEDKTNGYESHHSSLSEHQIQYLAVAGK